MNTRVFLISIAVCTAVLAMACGDGHGDHCSSVEEAICSGTMIQYCDGQHYGEPEACPEGQECMTMESGVTHCMLSSMMEGEDHSGMDMDDM